MNRIADLASGWTVEGDVPPESLRREASGPAGAADAARRKAKTAPPPPPGSAARKALEDKIVELRDISDIEELDEPPAPESRRVHNAPAQPAARAQPPRQQSGQVPVAPRPRRSSPPELGAVPEADKTKENRGAVGIKHDRSASLTTNAASGTIGGDTPPPIFDRAAIAAGPRNAERSSAVAAAPVAPDRRSVAVDDSLGPPGPSGNRAGDRRTGAVQNFDPGDRNAATANRLGSPGAVTNRAGDRRTGAAPVLDADRRSTRPSSPPELPLRGTPPGRSVPVGTGANGAIRGMTPANDRPSAPSLAPRRPLRTAAGSIHEPGARGYRGEADEAYGDAYDDSDEVAYDNSDEVAYAEAYEDAPDALRTMSGDHDEGEDEGADEGVHQDQDDDESDEDRDLSDVMARLSAPVPLGEFDHGVAPRESEKLRAAHAHATIKRDAPSALLGAAAPAAAARAPSAEVSFDDPTTVKPSAATASAAATSAPAAAPRTGAPAAGGPPGASPGTSFDDPTALKSLTASAFEDRARRERGQPDASGAMTGEYARGDSTDGERGDATALSSPLHSAPASASGTLRTSASLPRRPGFAGNLRYPFTVMLGLRRSRHELAALAAQQATRQQSRRRHLVTLGRAAANADGFTHPALQEARAQLSAIEDEREQHASHVVAADAELTRVRRDRDAAAKQHADHIGALDGEIGRLVKQIEPLDKEVVATKRRAANLQDALRRLDDKIAATESNLDGGNRAKIDPAQVQAELATLRADRKVIQADEPALASQLDALSPRIAGLEAERAETQRKRAELEAAEQEDQRRVEELLAAIGAKRKVVDRAASDAETRRDKLLFRLGEQLYVDRPRDLAGELAPIDEIDLELGSTDRKMMELREIVASVDRWKLVRGIALLIVVLAALGAIAMGVLYLAR